MPVKDNTLRKVEPRGVLQLEDIGTTDATNEEIEEWKIDGAIYAHMIYHPNCPPAFKKAFVNIFAEYLLKPCAEHGVPEIAALYAIAVTALQSWIPADANNTVEILHTLRDTLAPKFAKQIRDGLRLD